jgi:hypothetical protein
MCQTQLRREVSGALDSTRSEQKIGFAITIALTLKKGMMSDSSWAVFYSCTKSGKYVEPKTVCLEENEENKNLTRKQLNKWVPPCNVSCFFILLFHPIMKIVSNSIISKHELDIGNSPFLLFNQTTP